MPGRRRLPLFFTSILTGTVRDSRSTCRPTIVTVPFEVLSWQGGKRQPRGDAPLNANRVALERVNGQPQRGQVADAERRRAGSSI